MINKVLRVLPKASSRIKDIQNNNRNILVRRFCSSQEVVLGNYVIKSKMSGHSEENLYDKYKNFTNNSFKNLRYDLIPGTTVVTNKD